MRKNSRSRQQPYALGFSAFIGAAGLELWNRGERERFEMIFDDNPKFGQRAKLLYPKACLLMPPYRRSILPVEPMFKDDKRFMPLQAADMIAWFRRRAFDPKPHQFDWLQPALTLPESDESHEYSAEYMAEIMARKAREERGDDEK